MRKKKKKKSLAKFFLHRIDYTITILGLVDDVTVLYIWRVSFFFFPKYTIKKNGLEHTFWG